MATGDITAVSINADGWTADITVEGLADGGTYDFGYGAGNNPSTAKIVFSVTSEGYSNAKVLGTKARTVYGTLTQNESPAAVGALRKPDPNETSPEETISGDDVIITIPLSSFIYDDDTDITVSIAAGWYTESETPTNVCTDLEVTNNSAADYTRPIGNWAIVPRQTFLGTSIHLEFVAFHRFAEAGKPLACLEFTITDAHSNEVTALVTAMSKSSDSPYGKIIVYQADIDVSTLTDLDLCTAQVQCYPWVGDADAILDTNDAVYSFPTPHYTNLQFRLDKTGKHGHACVSAGGNDGTGVVYASQALAEAGNHYLTIAAALTALAAYNNTNAGHNDAGGGTIYLDESTWTLNSSNGGTLTEWVTITRQSTAAKANVHMQAAGSGSNIPTFLKISGVTHDGTTYFTGSGSRCLWIDDCTGATSGSLHAYWSPYCAVTNSSGVWANEFIGYGTAKLTYAFVRGVNCTTKHRTYGFCVLGSKNLYVVDRTSATYQESSDGGIFAYNQNYPADTGRQIDLGQHVDDLAHGYAIVQNVFERITAVVEPIIYMYADSCVHESTNVLMWYNTIAGSRINNAYNDEASGGPYYHTQWHQRNTIFDGYNIKDDTFGGDSDGIGGWSVGYHVDSSGNFYCTAATDEWFGEFFGLYYVKGTNAVRLEPSYVNDKSYRGTNDGGGDYHLNADSQAIGIAHDLLLPYDLDGIRRVADGAAGAYEYPTASDSYVQIGDIWEGELGDICVKLGSVLASSTATYIRFGSLLVDDSSNVYVVAGPVAIKT